MEEMQKEQFSLIRFLHAHEQSYQTALEEIREGEKRTHWMWYIFPQYRGLGFSPVAEYYAIQSLQEARGYISEPVLRSHLFEISQALLDLKENDAEKILGYPDNLKLRSCMTLFLIADPDAGILQQVLDKFFKGIPDEKTIELVRTENCR